MLADGEGGLSVVSGLCGKIHLHSQPEREEGVERAWDPGRLLEKLATAAWTRRELFSRTAPLRCMHTQDFALEKTLHRVAERRLPVRREEKEEERQREDRTPGVFTSASKKRKHPSRRPRMLTRKSVSLKNVPYTDRWIDRQSEIEQGR